MENNYFVASRTDRREKHHLKRIMEKANYYVLTYSINSKEVGVIDQVKYLTINTDQEIIRQYQGKSIKTWTNKVPDYSVFRLQPRAKLTDLLSANKFVSLVQSVLVSNKLRGIIEKYKTDNFRFYNAIVTDKNEKKHQYNVCGVNLTPDIIDYPASEFMITNIAFSQNLEPISVSSFDDLHIKEDMLREDSGWQTDPKYIKLNKVVLKEKWDLIRLPQFYNILVSERLKDDMQNAGINGVGFDDSKLVFFTL